jgi:hypothetical protein
MYGILILFFASLVSIIVIISRKLVLLKNGQILRNKEEEIFTANYFEEWKHLTVKNLKKYGYAGLVALIRLYVHLINFLKNKYQEIKIFIKNKLSRAGSRPNGDLPKKQEVSKFLKMISEYKQKIRNIKEKVKKEENL